MKKVMWLGLTTAVGALVIAGATVLLEDGMRAGMPTPAPGGSSVFSPPDAAEIRLPAQTVAGRSEPENGRPSPPPSKGEAGPAPGETGGRMASERRDRDVAGSALAEETAPTRDQALTRQAGVAGGVVGGVPGGVVGGVVGDPRPRRGRGHGRPTRNP